MKKRWSTLCTITCKQFKFFEKYKIIFDHIDMQRQTISQLIYSLKMSLTPEETNRFIFWEKFRLRNLPCTECSHLYTCNVFCVISESVPVTLEIADPSGRHKRSAGETTPDNIQVKVTSPSDVTILYVRRVRRHVTTPKIYSATKNGFIEEETMKAGVRIWH